MLMSQFHIKQTRNMFVPPGGRVVNGAFMVLKGHRSIVNQVRFNPHTYMICSSGVEKVIKVSKRTSSPYFYEGSHVAPDDIVLP